MESSLQSAFICGQDLPLLQQYQSFIDVTYVHIAIRHRPVIPLEQDGAGAIGTVEARPRSPFAEESDVLAVLLAELDPEGLGLADVFVVQTLEGGVVGLTIADIHVLVDGLAVPAQ